MLAIKIYNNKKNRDSVFTKTIESLNKYISEILNFSKARVISDSDCVEIVSGNTNIINNDDQIIAELLIKKSIVINKSDFSDREELDKFLSKVKHFCKQAKEIEEIKYIPFNLRNKEKKINA